MNLKSRHYERPRLAGYQFWCCQLPVPGVGDVLVARPTPSRWVFGVGDVYGSGEPASRSRVAVMDDLVVLAGTEPEPGSILERLNRDLFDPSGESSVFMTLFLAVLDGEHHQVELANAGCVPQFMRHADGSVEELDDFGGMPLGITPDQTYESVNVPIGPGGVLVLLSDGISSLMDSSLCLFGQDRLRTAIAQAPGGAASVGQSILRAVRQFEPYGPQPDHITLLCVGRVANAPAP